jgi:hypothetical protein
MSKLRKATCLVFGMVFVVAVGSGMAVVRMEKKHLATHGHYVPSTESHREFVSPPFQLTEENLGSK